MDDALHHLGGGHDGAGVAGGDESIGITIAHQARGHAHGTVALGPEGARRAVLHSDLLGGVDNLDGQAAVVVVLLQFPPQNFLPADQDDPDPKRSGRLDGPFDFRFRGVVSAHCVDSNGDHVGRVATPARLPLLRGPCIVRSAGTRDAAVLAHDSWGIRTFREFSAHRARGDFASAAKSGVVSDSAFRYLKEFTPELRGFQIVFRSFRPWSAAHRLPAWSSLQSHGVSLRLPAARGTDPFAILAADPLHGHRQHDLLA